MQKYELLALFPLTTTEDELKAAALGVEEKLKTAGATVHQGLPLQKGRLQYPVSQVRQGYYHLIQFELEPGALNDLKRTLILAGDMLRFTITQQKGDFKTFVPTAPKAAAPARTWKRQHAPLVAPILSPTPAQPAPQLTQETPKPTEEAKVTMEDIDKRLEEILKE
ncbi:MAG: 30S ribosomal protein S6 [Parcubacteria group bacterium GW2011_GWC2_45_7]|nr:MAG: 30S ribosomal protein S6 [Parcubacteria group bacterium GW2011_GWC2_45_7]KKU71907.1 MAG: 30S ribosomal protein S6 [Parcubacteria group bacterium GW2011_GWA2_47_26]